MTDLPPTPATNTRTAPITLPPIRAPASQDPFAPGPQPSLFPADLAPAFQPATSAFAPGPQQELTPLGAQPGPDAFAPPNVNASADPALSVTQGLSIGPNGEAVFVELPPTPATGSSTEPLPPPEVVFQQQEEAATTDEVRSHDT